MTVKARNDNFGLIPSPESSRGSEVSVLTLHASWLAVENGIFLEFFSIGNSADSHMCKVLTYVNT